MAVAMDFSPSYHHVSTTNYHHHHHHHHHHQYHLMMVIKKKSVLTMRPPHNSCTRYYHVPSYSQHYLHVSPSSPCDQNDSDFEGLCRNGHIQEALPLLFFQIMDPQSSLLPPLFLSYPWILLMFLKLFCERNNNRDRIALPFESCSGLCPCLHRSLHFFFFLSFFLSFSFFFAFALVPS